MAAEPGWYDDGTGAMRWWDGSRWTEHFADFGGPEVELHADADGSRISGDLDAFGGIAVDGRWIRMGDFGQPVGGVAAVLATTAELAKRPAVVNATRMRTLFTPAGPLTPRHFSRLDRRALALAIESPQMVWLSFPHPAEEARARQFANWVNRSAEHYRYR